MDAGLVKTTESHCSILPGILMVGAGGSDHPGSKATAVSWLTLQAPLFMGSEARSLFWMRWPFHQSVEGQLRKVASFHLFLHLLKGKNTKTPFSMGRAGLWDISSGILSTSGQCGTGMTARRRVHSVGQFHRNLVSSVWLLFPFYRWGHWDAVVKSQSHRWQVMELGYTPASAWRPSHTLPPPHFHTNTSNCNCQVCWWMSKVRILIKVSLFTGHMLQLKLHQNLPQISASRERAFCEHLVCDQFMWEPREGSYSFTHWINIYWAPTMCQTLRCWGKSSEQDRQVPGLMEIAF